MIETPETRQTFSAPPIVSMMPNVWTHISPGTQLIDTDLPYMNPDHVQAHQSYGNRDIES